MFQLGRQASSALFNRAVCSDDKVLFCIVQYANVANVTEVLSFKFYLIIINFEKIMSSGPITSWKIDGETVSDFIFLGSKIATDGDCSHEIKRHLLLGRKVETNLDSILKSRDITLPTKFRLVKAMVFPVVMYGCDSWTVKKAEC